MSLLRKGILVSLGQFLGVFLSLLGTMILSRSLGREGVGQYDLLRSVAILAATIASFGIGNASIYFLRNQGTALPDITTTSAKALLVLGGVLAVVIATALRAMPQYFGIVPLYVCVLFGLGVGGVLGVCLMRPILVADLAARRMVAVDVSLPLVLLVGAVTLRVTGRLDINNALLLQAAGNLASCLVAVRYLLPHLQIRQPFDWRLLNRLLRYGIRLFASNILQVLLSAATIMILRYLTLQDFGQVGLFTRASAMCNLATLVPMAIGPLLYAKWSSVETQARVRQVETAGRLNFTYGLAVAALLVVLGKYVLWLLYGKAFMAGQVAVYALAPSVALFSFFTVYNNLFAGDGRAGITAWILAATVVTVVVASWFLVPRLGIVGASLAALLAQLVSLVAAAIIGWRIYGINPFRCLVVTPADIRYVWAQLLPMKRTA